MTKEKLAQLFEKVEAFVFDVDGVLTNSSLLVTENGNLLRIMNVRDGYAIKTALDKGYKVAIITGGSSEGVIKRLQGLGVKDIYTKVFDKKSVLEDWLLKEAISAENVAYMGDDFPDYEVLQIVGLPACPADAAPEIQHICRYHSHVNGGEGCARDLIEKTLKIQHKWHSLEGFTD
ncbi:MAG: HAD hydrolase family protein [Chitinophagales bacterium]|nr:HAD hydrolase family protein [Bacteroidota bacterium]MCB9042741.1 HAD hydrolase family protein [Chitinophagales bacterium]